MITFASCFIFNDYFIGMGAINIESTMVQIMA